MLRKSLQIDARIPPPARVLLPLVQQLLAASKSQALKAIHAECVRVNRLTVTTPHTRLEVGDRIEVQLDEAAILSPPRAVASGGELAVVFQDEHLLIVDKPPGMLTVPTYRGERNTVIGRLERLLSRGRDKEEVFCCHRLDRDVSGLLVFARKLALAEAIREQFHDRKPQRRYVAIVSGVMARDAGTIRSRLATDKQLNRYSTDDPETGQLAVTHFRVLKRLPAQTVVEIRLETGRRNQIRVHLAEAGHPVLGDTRYGPRQLSPEWPYSRLALHAASLGFVHPVTGKPLQFESPLPPEMEQLIGPGAPGRESSRKRRTS